MFGPDDHGLHDGDFQFFPCLKEMRMMFRK